MDKKVEDLQAISEGSLSILEATAILAENLTQSEPFLRLHESEHNLNQDVEANRLITAFNKLRQKIITDQNAGKFNESDIHQLRSLQLEIAENQTIQEVNLAQESAKELLREVNQEISQILGFDFSLFAKRASGCC